MTPVAIVPETTASSESGGADVIMAQMAGQSRADHTISVGTTPSGPAWA